MTGNKTMMAWLKHRTGIEQMPQSLVEEIQKMKVHEWPVQQQPEESIFPENAIRCPHCHKFSGVGMDFEYSMHAPDGVEIKTIGAESFCMNCKRYVNPTNKWLEGKMAND